jgi:hypothetical protein
MALTPSILSKKEGIKMVNRKIMITLLCLPRAMRRSFFMDHDAC